MFTVIFAEGPYLIYLDLSSSSTPPPPPPPAASRPSVCSVASSAAAAAASVASPAAGPALRSPGMVGIDGMAGMAGIAGMDGMVGMAALPSQPLICVFIPENIPPALVGLQRTTTKNERGLLKCWMVMVVLVVVTLLRKCEYIRSVRIYSREMVTM